MHTPGSWECDDELTEGKISIYARNWQEHHQLDELGEQVLLADVVSEEVDEEAALANAKLMAAAPDMLQLLIDMEHDLRQRAVPDDYFVPRLRAMIAQASTSTVA